jgi:methionyl-tRNA formyltransferase
MIIFAAYRDWAIKACLNFRNKTLIINSKDELIYAIKKYEEKIHAIIFVGWSEIISNEIIDKYLCLCYHPSDLPLYRGGSPLQHQIIDGVKTTKGTLFRMNRELDSGPIFHKEELSLGGDMDKILNNLEKNASLLIEKFIESYESKEKIDFYTQDEQKATIYKRRKPEMSEITQDELLNSNGLYLYNKIRSLGDPYPNAYIKTSDGRRLLIKKVELL